MINDTPHAQIIKAACTMLVAIQGIMLASLYLKLAPHPPRTIPLFAMAPFLAVSIGTALCAMQLAVYRSGRVLAALAALMALLSFGPQKYFDPAFSEIWIAVIASQLAVLSIAYALFLARTKD